jgi:hypothetical protein
MARNLQLKLKFLKADPYEEEVITCVMEEFHEKVINLMNWQQRPPSSCPGSIHASGDGCNS